MLTCKMGTFNKFGGMKIMEDITKWFKLFYSKQIF